MNELQNNNVIDFYRKAQVFVEKNFPDEIRWCDERPPFEEFSEQDFLREYAWVVLNSGFRYKVIAKKWKDLLAAFCWFEPELIWENHNKVRDDALAVFGNRKKIAAILSMAGRLATGDFQRLKADIQRDPLKFIEMFPFIGKVTKFHLARNLGFDYIKPDRHIVRIAERFGTTPIGLGRIIHQVTGQRLGTIDVILWRYMEQREGESEKQQQLDPYLPD